MKHCKHCGRDTDDWYTSPGNGWACAACHRRWAIERRQRRIERIGAEAERQRSRASVRRYRARMDEKAKQRELDLRAAYGRAIIRLREAHREEFDTLYRDEAAAVKR